MAAIRKSAASWLAIGWIGFAVLPWYFEISALSPAGSGLAIGLAGGRAWLVPLALPLLLGLLPLLRPRQGATGGLWLILIGAAGLVWVGLEGFAIGHRGWAFEWLAQLFGAPGPTQGGMGYGAFLTVLGFLMLLCHGLAMRGVCGGDAFTASALGLIIAVTVLFVFFPIARVLTSAVEDNTGQFAPAEFFASLFDRSIWGVDCVYSGVSCGVAWNSLFLALGVAAGTTALGLGCALIVTRTGFRFKRTLRALTIVPIITPPFVILVDGA